MHIAWLILKIILLTLGILLGIAVILLLLVLFVPIRYQVDADIHGKPDIRARVSWMSFFLDLRAQYKEGKFLYYLRSFWVLLATNDESRIKSSEKEESGGFRRRQRKKKSGDKKRLKDQESEDIPIIDTMGIIDTGISGEDDYEPWEPDYESWETDKPELSGESEIQKKSVWDYIRGFFHSLEFVFTLPARIVAGICFIWSRIKGVMDNVKAFLERILKKLKQINKKRIQIVKLWGLSTTKTALANVKGYVLDLLLHVKPKKLSGALIIGCKDPALTGQLFGILGLLLPIYYDNINITADFEQARVEGDIHMKGDITIFYLLCLLLKIYKDKYTMKTYERVKKILGGS